MQATGLFIVVAAALIAVGALPTVNAPVRPPASTRAVLVGSSDTLWSIAVDHRIPGVSTSDMVTAIRRASGLCPAEVLHPGAVVKVPALDRADTAFALR